MKLEKKFYFKLFISTFYLSAFTFGGGFVIISLMRKKFVDEYQWIEEGEMLDLTAIAQSSPGAIAVNAAILVGYRLAGITGAMITVLGTVLPPLLILSVLSVAYAEIQNNLIVKYILRGMQAGVAAVIMDVVINLVTRLFKGKKIFPLLIMFGAFIAVFFFRINVIYVILISGFLGGMDMMFQKSEKRGGQAK